jgi:hypothetical protein
VTTQLDSSIGIKKETTFGTAVVVDRFPEFLSESLDWKPEYMTGRGLRVGSRVQRANRRQLGRQHVEGDISLEACSRGLGIFFEALLGQATSTIIGAGPGYQHLFTLTNTDPFPTYTIQKGIPLIGGGAAQPTTFAGMACTRGTLNAAVGEIVKLETSWFGKSASTAVAYAAPSYVASTSQELFTFMHGAITLGTSAVTPPTTVALATGGTSVGNVRDFTLTIDNKLDTSGYTFGSQGMLGRRPTLGATELSGKITAEFDSITNRDFFLNNTTVSITMTFMTSTVLTTGSYNTLQVTLPAVKLDGDTPKAVADGVVTQDIGFTVLDNSTDAPVYVVLRNLDTLA